MVQRDRAGGAVMTTTSLVMLYVTVLLIVLGAVGWVWHIVDSAVALTMVVAYILLRKADVI